MKRVLAIAAALAFAPLAGAQLYKYTDKDGKTVYTDQPPMNVQAKPVAAPPPGPAAATPKAAEGNKSAVARDKEAEKARDHAKDAQKKQEEAAKRAQQAEERCTQARTAFQQFSGGGRLTKYNEKGEREYLSDDEIAKGRDKARQEMEEACKKS